MRFQLVSDDNRKVYLNMAAIDAYTAKRKPGTPFDLSITYRVKKVSDPQRKYYWSTVLPCFLDAYYYERDEADLVHRFLKIKFFGIQPDKHGIHREKDMPSVFSDNPTANPDERKQFLDWVIRLCSQSDNPQYVPEPGE